MNKIKNLPAIVTVLVLMAGSVYAACIAGGNICYDGTGGVTLGGSTVDATGDQSPSYTKATLVTITPGKVGNGVFCTDCNKAMQPYGSTCISSGTGRGAYVISGSSLTAVTQCQ